MSLLFVDACPRGSALSRTYQMADAFLAAFAQVRPDIAIEAVHLPTMGLKPYVESMIDRREALINQGRLDDSMFDLAWQFATAQYILIAAPYWDLSFPAVLKTYIEHIFARTITFVYEGERPIGLCKTKRMIYLTTAGSFIGENDFGGKYLHAVSHMLGIERFDQITAEGLDIDNYDASSILINACEKARALANTFEA